MNKNVFDISKNRTKPGNWYYLVQFVNRTKTGIVLSETVLSGESLYFVLLSKIIILEAAISRAVTHGRTTTWIQKQILEVKKKLTNPSNSKYHC